MNHFLKFLLLSPTLFSPIVSIIMVAPTHANSTTWVEVSKDYTCKRTVTRQPKQLVCKRIDAGATTAGDIVDLTKSNTNLVDDGVSADGTPLPSFDFTDEESDTSVALFGCDCPVCIRSLRQLRNMMS